jgi:hypothetical protein
MKYVITVKGKRYMFATLQSAKDCAEAIFQKTGIIVGIETYQTKGETK